MKNLTPFYVTGAAEADGCFQFGFESDKGRPFGYRFFLQFSLTQSSDNEEFVHALKNFFGIGKVKYLKNDTRCDFLVSSQKDLEQVIVHHFLKYPLVGEKMESFVVLQMLLEQFRKKQGKGHTTETFFWAIAGIYKINPEKRKQTKFYYVDLVIKTLKQQNLNNDYLEIENQFNLLFQKKVIEYQNLTLGSKLLETDYILGLTQGDGCFSPQTRVERSATFAYDIAFLSHVKNEKLMKMVENFFGTKGIYHSKSENCSHFKIKSTNLLRNVVIPFFSENPLGFRKQLQFEIFKENFARIKLL